MNRTCIDCEEKCLALTDGHCCMCNEFEYQSMCSICKYRLDKMEKQDEIDHALENDISIREKRALKQMIDKLISRMGNAGHVSGYYLATINQYNTVKEFKLIDGPERIWENHRHMKVAIILVQRPQPKLQTSLEQFIGGT